MEVPEYIKGKSVSVAVELHEPITEVSNEGRKLSSGSMTKSALSVIYKFMRF